MLANAKLHLDAGRLSPTFKDGNPVTFWPDLSPTSSDAVFQTKIMQHDKAVNAANHTPPTFREGIVNSLPVVDFDASKKQTLVLNCNGSSLDRDVSGFTLFTVIRAPYVEEDNYLFITHVSNFDTRFSIILRAGHIRFNIRHRTGAKPVPAECKNAVLKNNEFGLLVVGVTYHEGTYYCRYNAVQAEISSPPDDFKGKKIRTEDVNSPYNAIASTGLENHLTCQIAELMCFGDFYSQEQVVDAEKMLMAKYGLKK